MTEDTKLLLNQWLVGDDVDKRRHAENRLAIHEYPPLKEQAANLVRSAGRAIISGFATVPEDERDRRRLICMNCEFYDGLRERCMKCGCFGRWKTFLATEHCPLPEPKW